ncbi:MAG: EAL domain-containing protein, partial [Thermoleophilaceae bacterium]|nr:EAL domain-containing protein [Thermoleophilaceae bacterium]
MERLLLDLSVNVTGMFRDPTFYAALREQVIPLLRTYPFLRVWNAGCSTGEEAYSVAILLHEEGLLDRSRAADPHRLCLDISDSAALDHRRFRMASFDEPRAAGVGLALNDFGAACPSLSRLRDLPLEPVKLDASLIHAEEAGDGKPSLIAAMLELAHALGLRTVAMGVETAQQADRVSALGVNRAQGSFYATPLPGPAVTELLATGTGSLPATAHVDVERRRKAA